MGQLDEQIEGVGQGETDVDTKAALAVIKRLWRRKDAQQTVSASGCSGSISDDA